MTRYRKLLWTSIKLKKLAFTSNTHNKTKTTTLYPKRYHLWKEDLFAYSTPLRADSVLLLLQNWKIHALDDVLRILSTKTLRLLRKCTVHGTVEVFWISTTLTSASQICWSFEGHVLSVKCKMLKLPALQKTLSHKTIFWEVYVCCWFDSKLGRWMTKVWQYKSNICLSEILLILTMNVSKEQLNQTF